MTTAAEILTDAFTRVHEELPNILDRVDAETILWQPDPAANSIGWLVWHLSRVQDDHLAGVGARDQVWTAGGFARRFDLPYDDDSIGYGHSADEVRAFAVTDTDLLLEYHAAVHRLTLDVLDGFGDDGYSRIVDEDWDPPVTAAVRLVSVIGDIHQHLGQIAYIAGLAERR